MTTTTEFINQTIAALQVPINAWFDAQDATGLSGVLSRARVAITTLGRFRDELTHAIDLAAAIGTDRRLTKDQQAQLDLVKQQQVAYAIGFINDLPNESRAQALARAASYVSAVTQVISQFRTDHLENNQDFPTLPVYPGDKALDCRGYCKCTLRIIKQAGTGNWDVFWDLHAGESCKSCVALNQSWAPLEIRNYQVQQAKAVHLHDVEILSAVLKMVFYEN